MSKALALRSGPAAAPAAETPGQIARDLVAQAQASLRHRDREATHELIASDAKRNRIEAVITSALEVLAEENSEENCASLERSIEVAQKAQLLPEIRVKARRFLDKCRNAHQEAGVHEARIQKLMRQLERCFGGGAEPKASEAHRRLQEHNLVKQLQQALDEGSRKGLAKETAHGAEELIKRVERTRLGAEQAAGRLRRLELVEDLEELEEQLQRERERCRHFGPGVWQLIDKQQERLSRLQQQEQQQQWLNTELNSAAETCNAVRLHQLVHQARILDLIVPPAVLTLLHGLEASKQLEPTAVQARPRGKDHLERMRTFADRQKEQAQLSVLEAEDDPTPEDLKDAKQALAIAKQTKVPEEDLARMERRLAAVEAVHGPRFEVEAKLEEITRMAEWRSPDKSPVAVELSDMATVEELRSLLRQGERFGADPDILEQAFELLSRSLDAEASRQNTHRQIRQAMALPMRSEGDLDMLEQAVAEGKRAGVPTLQAEKELRRLREIQVQREAAEAELQEAAKGVGPKGRKRLEEAIQNAKAAGVSAEKVHVANHRLEGLTSHEEACALAAGDIRRALPLLRTQPWRFQHLINNAKSLQPWTFELERLVEIGEERLRRSLALQSQQKEVEQELHSMVKQIRASRAGGQSCSPESAEQLTQLIERARSSGDTNEKLLGEASKQLESFTRERCQREVAEHRLRLALKAKDLGEIEKSMRQVRALGHVVAESSAPAGLGKAEPPHSARLMEAASSMLRHLSDGSAKRQAVVSALQDRLSETPAASARAASARAAGPGGSGPGSARSDKNWFKDVSGMLQEARQCGVPPTVIAHAKLKVRERRREHRERTLACEALQTSLSKKDAPTQEVLQNLRKLQRFADADTP